MKDEALKEHIIFILFLYACEYCAKREREVKFTYSNSEQLHTSVLVKTLMSFHVYDLVLTSLLYFQVVVEV